MKNKLAHMPPPHASDEASAVRRLVRIRDTALLAKSSVAFALGTSVLNGPELDRVLDPPAVGRGEECETRTVRSRYANWPRCIAGACDGLGGRPHSDVPRAAVRVLKCGAVTCSLLEMAAEFRQAMVGRIWGG